MSENISDAELNVSEIKLRDTLSYLTSLIFNSNPAEIPSSISDMPEVQKIVFAINEIRSVLFLAKKGDFSYSIKSKGFIFGSLKALQSNLNHIAWVTRQVADGDLEQRMDFMGEFSSAFNSMTEQLAAVLNKLNEQKDHFSYRALHDPLTGLTNRAYFNEQIVNEIARAKRRRSLLAVVVADMDKFKIVNDTMGHQAGDDLLIEVAKRLLKSTREMDTVARIGGDEFGMLWPCDSGDEQSFVKIKDRIISNIKENGEISGSEYNISISIGVSIYPYDGDDPQELFRKADNAMYRAKRTDGPSCVFASNKITPSL